MLADSLANETVNSYLRVDYEQALTLAGETLRISRSIGNPWGQAHGQWVVGPIYFEYGRPDKAIEVMEETIRLSDEGGLVPLQISARSNLGWLYGSLGDLLRSFDLAGAAKARAEEFLPAWRPLPLAIQARLHLREGDLSAAETAIAESYESLKPDSIAAIFVTVAAGEVDLAMQAYDRVISRLDTFLGRLHQLGIRSVRSEAPYLKGQALLAQEQMEEARAILDKARLEAEALGQRNHLWSILIALSHIEPDPARALEAASRSYRRSHRRADQLTGTTNLLSWAGPGSSGLE